jgi:hypothetical protein
MIRNDKTLEAIDKGTNTCQAPKDALQTAIQHIRRL